MGIADGSPLAGRSAGHNPLSSAFLFLVLVLICEVAMRNDQRSLFDSATVEETAPHVAGSKTSKAAASEISPYLGRLQACVFDYIASRGPLGATDQEVQEALSIDSSTQRPRRYELANKGLIRQAGIKRKTKSGRKAQVWIAVQ